MSIGAEINSLMKWLTLFVFLNGGLVSVCFGLMLKENACSKYLQDTFFYVGYGALLVGGLSLFLATVDLFASFATNRKKARELERKKATLLAELNRLRALRGVAREP